MAMNKGERAAMDDLRQQAAEARAMRFLGVPQPKPADLPARLYVNGWACNPHDRNGTVYEAWASQRRSGRGHRTDQRDYFEGGSQKSERLFATRLDALIALRLAKEAEVARVLAAIDLEIEREREGEP